MSDPSYIAAVLASLAALCVLVCWPQIEAGFRLLRRRSARARANELVAGILARATPLERSMLEIEARRMNEADHVALDTPAPPPNPGANLWRHHAG